MSQDLERLVVEQAQRITVLEVKHTALTEDMEQILSKLDSIKDEMTRYKGFIGGIAFVGGALLTAGTIFKEWVIQHFFK